MDKVTKGIANVFSVITLGLLGGVMLFAGIDVFNRLIAGSSICWAQQGAVWLNCFVIFLFVPVMVLERSHIKVTFLFDKLKGLARKIASGLNQIALIAFSLLAFWVGMNYVVYQLRGMYTRVLGMWDFPYYIIALCVPLGMFFALVFSIYLFFSKSQEKTKGKDK